MKTQNERILNHLLKGKSITPIAALNLFGTFRLSARIHNLRDKGYPIVTKHVTKGNKTFAQYYIDKQYFNIAP